MPFGGPAQDWVKACCKVAAEAASRGVLSVLL